ncbi:MAG: hypothetical protein R3F20_09140 [Planctomycetota bacterium]
MGGAKTKSMVRGLLLALFTAAGLVAGASGVIAIFAVLVALNQVNLKGGPEPSDRLERLLNRVFWIELPVTVAALSLLGAVLGLLFGIWYLRRSNRSPSTRKS